jgi:plasmid stabilization system protein ParE
LIVRFSTPAQGDRREAARFYEREVRGLGERFKTQLKRTIDRVIAYPQIGSVLEAPVRSARVSGFPYAVVYVIDHDVLRILAVMHDARDPETVRSRLR